MGWWCQVESASPYFTIFKHRRARKRIRGFLTRGITLNGVWRWGVDFKNNGRDKK
jgi:hypothetical protein